MEKKIWDIRESLINYGYEVKGDLVYLFVSGSNNSASQIEGCKVFVPYNLYEVRRGVLENSILFRNYYRISIKISDIVSFSTFEIELRRGSKVVSFSSKFGIWRRM